MENILTEMQACLNELNELGKVIQGFTYLDHNFLNFHRERIL